jgi:phage gpG-like protein
MAPPVVAPTMLFGNTPLASARSFASSTVSPSAAAGVRVEFELGRFNQSLDRYLQVVQPNVHDAVRTVALDLLARIKQRTPVDTGRLRNSFHAVMPGQTDNYSYSDREGRGYDGSLGVTPKVSVLKGEVEAVVGTNVDYAIFIEAGHSRKAPRGMVAVSVLELTGALEKAVEAALTQALQGA